MTGQWIGAFSGDYTGNLIVNVDEFRAHYGGSAAFLPSDAKIPGIQVTFRTESKDTTFRAKTTSTSTVNAATQLRDSWENMKGTYSRNCSAEFRHI